MEGDRELKHCCKVCWKRFPNGRSLGGHMRSHLSLNTATAFDADEGENSKKAWRLRENPKKTWRLSDSGNGESSMSGCKLCRVCGKGFPSAKALYGHMKCHSDKCSFGLEEGEWSYGDQNGGKESQSDSEVTAVVVPRRKRRRRSKRVAAIAGLSTSLSSESEKEREDGALSLMMLSRDVKFSVTESSDKNSVVLEDKESELGVSGNGHLKKGLKKVESDVSVCEFVMDDELDEFGGTSSKGDELKSNLNCDSVKKGRYQCAACSKIFHSYQALGGHRASHKRIDAYFASMEVNSPVESVSLEADTVRKVDTRSLDAMAGKKGKIHECPICRKVFSSGQALGGHKRSHMFTSSETIAKQSSMPVSIDLNLPASIGESSNHGGSEATTNMSQFWFI